MILSVVMMVGGVVGAQIGVRFAKKVKGAPARILLALIIIAVCIRMLMTLFVQPADLYSLDIRL
jgi:hypothetical protein